jgi:hypothetical protein
MSRRRKQKLKAIRKDRPPFMPLSPNDAQLIADAAGLKCADDTEFFDELEEVRDRYRARYRFREITSTDRQLRAEIQDARHHIARLRAFFSNGNVSLASSVLFIHESKQSGAAPNPVYPDRFTAHAAQQKALGYLDDWVKLLNDKFERQAAIRPNSLAPPSAEKLGLVELVFSLAQLWSRRSGDVELPAGRKSRWILFLKQSLKTIAQLDISDDAARKLTDRAIEYPTTVEYKTSGVWLEN